MSNVVIIFYTFFENMGYYNGQEKIPAKIRVTAGYKLAIQFY